MRLGFAVFLILSLSVVSAQESTKQNPADAGNHQAQPNSHQAAPKSPAVRPEVTFDASGVDRSGQNAKQETESEIYTARETGYLAWFTFALVIVTGILAFVGVRQLFYLGKADATAALAAQATRDSVIAMQDTAKRQLRAYVSVEKIEPRHFTNHEVVFRLQNVGQTPARAVSVRGAAFLATNPPDLKTMVANLSAPQPTQILFPNGTVEGSCSGARTQRAAPNFVEYLFVEVSYTDVFGGVHTTRRCACRHFPNGNLVAYDQGNEAD